MAVYAFGQTKNSVENFGVKQTAIYLNYYNVSVPVKMGYFSKTEIVSNARIPTNYCKPKIS